MLQADPGRSSKQQKKLTQPGSRLLAKLCFNPLLHFSGEIADSLFFAWFELGSNICMPPDGITSLQVKSTWDDPLCKPTGPILSQWHELKRANDRLRESFSRTHAT